MGVLAPNKGTACIFSELVGLVEERHIVEGEAVAKDAVLFVVEAGRDSSNVGDVLNKLTQQIESRQQSLQTEQLKQLKQTKGEARLPRFLILMTFTYL